MPNFHFNQYLIFNPSSTEIALAFDDEMEQIKKDVTADQCFYSPTVFCSDAFVYRRHYQRSSLRHS